MSVRVAIFIYPPSLSFVHLNYAKVLKSVNCLPPCSNRNYMAINRCRHTFSKILIMTFCANGNVRTFLGEVRSNYVDILLRLLRNCGTKIVGALPPLANFRSITPYMYAVHLRAFGLVDVAVNIIY